ncbi:zf-HC2 domain-containing protein, partial [Streptomyces sp. CRN 30]|uniref:zf-HC2 domain-containing protein n=1 Tax=Streptomyces sp. CRN 30 TaxID=3075613 RepID=UPI002A833763
MTTTDPHGATGAYALDALEQDEREEFERHLAGCRVCARETAELCATAVRLGLAVAAAPGPGLRERVLERVAGCRQAARGPAPDRAGR